MISKKFDFTSSLILIAAAVYVIYESVDIYYKAKEPMYLSPALVPLMLGILLLLCSVILLMESLKGSSAGARFSEFAQWFAVIKQEAATKRMLIGTIIIGIYTYFLLGTLPFMASTVIFMVALMMYLKIGSFVKILLISIMTVLITHGLFQELFRVPLP